MQHDLGEKDCAHCVINSALDQFSEAHSPVNTQVLIEALATVMCELIAMTPKRDDRRQIVKHVQGVLPGRVSRFREEGRYPGGPSGTNDHLTLDDTECEHRWETLPDPTGGHFVACLKCPARRHID